MFTFRVERATSLPITEDIGSLARSCGRRACGIGTCGWVNAWRRCQVGSCVKYSHHTMKQELAFLKQSEVRRSAGRKNRRCSRSYIEDFFFRRARNSLCFKNDGVLFHSAMTIEVMEVRDRKKLQKRVDALLTDRRPQVGQLSPPSEADMSGSLSTEDDRRGRLALATPTKKGVTS